MLTDKDMEKEVNLISENDLENNPDDELIDENKILNRVGVVSFAVAIIGFVIVFILFFMYVLFPEYKDFIGESERGFAIDSVVPREEQ